jgi:hypothetical protein
MVGRVHTTYLHHDRALYQAACTCGWSSRRYQRRIDAAQQAVEHALVSPCQPRVGSLSPG